MRPDPHPDHDPDGPPSTVIFGLGATKSGTSWLYRYLASHPECHMRTVKELHYFDAEAPQALRFQLQQLRTRRQKIGDAQEAVERDGPEWRRLERQMRDLNDLIRLQKARKPGDYVAYLGNGRGHRTVVGDITPAYGLLPAARLASMATLAPHTRFIYLMRDPVARLWSHVRMIAMRSAGKDGDASAEVARIFDDALSGKAAHITIRGDYAGALDRIHEGVPAPSLFIAFFEELFSAETVTRLCQFLGIAQVDGRIDHKVHSGLQIEMTAEQRQRAMVALRPQYDHVAARMGRVPPAWVANMTGAV